MLPLAREVLLNIPPVTWSTSKRRLYSAHAPPFAGFGRKAVVYASLRPHITSSGYNAQFARSLQARHLDYA